MSSAGQWWTVLARICVAAVLCVSAQAQSQLTITPSPTIHAVAGTTPGYAGDNGSATAASFRSPRAIARDAAGNLYVADTGNHVVRRIDPSGTITTIAGNGHQGFFGDGSSATAAELNRPSGIAIAPDGTLYIADTLNHRVRKVAVNGIISTVAGSGALAPLGDNTSATNGSLRKPVAVALDVAGDLYIADAADFRIRKVDTKGIMTTVAGTGKQGNDGDGGLAINAELDTPSSLAFDTAGHLFIADRGNGRVRMIQSDGKIEPVAYGKASAGTPAFVRPDGIAISADGSLYIADAGDQKLLRQTSTVLGTEAGDGEQALSTDGSAATTADLDRPTAVMVDSSGSVFFTERGGRISQLMQATLQFGPLNIGSSAQQGIRFANTGQSPLTISTATLPQQFSLLPGSCGAIPIHLSARQSCDAQISYVPTLSGTFSGAATFSGSDFLPQTVQLSAQSLSATRIATTTALQAASPASAGQPLTITATVYASGAGTPTGDITFLENNTALGSAAVASNKAQWTIASAAAGTHTFTASYSGDTLFAPSTSAQAIAMVGTSPPDFTLSTGNSTTTSLTVAAGAPALFQFQIAPSSGAYGQTVTFSTQGLPPGIIASFDPPAVVPGSNPQTVLMTIKVVQTGMQTFTTFGVAVFCFCIPLMFRRRKRGLLLTSVMLLAGCASRPAMQKDPEKPANPQRITILATSVTPSGSSVSRSITLLLTVK